MKRILVPTDFSPTAEKAFHFAVNLASKAKGTVVLYHVYTPLESVFIDTENGRKAYNTKTEANVLKRLQRLKNKVVGNSSEVPVSTIAGRSPLTGNILRFAEQHHIDLIVMGTQGASGLRKAIIGSEAARIAEKSILPVLLIPEKYVLEEPEQFVFATNYLPADQQALTLVSTVARLYHAAITVLHLLDSHQPEKEKEKERNDFDTYAYCLPREFNESNMKFHLMEATSLSEALETLDNKFPYDIMVMVRRKKSFLERFFIKSFTKNMAYTTKKPLLIIPEI